MTIALANFLAAYRRPEIKWVCNLYHSQTDTGFLPFAIGFFGFNSLTGRIWKMYDGDIIKSVLKGKQQDFALLVEKYQQPVFRTANGLVHNTADAEEITQDVFLKAFFKLSSFNGKAAFSTWLYRIAVNTSLNFLKKKKRNQFWTGLTSLLQLPSKDKNAEMMLVEKSQQQLIELAIEQLPFKQRTAFVLTKYEELPQREVATIMHSSEGAVEQLVIRAKTNLKKILEKDLVGHRMPDESTV